MAGKQSIYFLKRGLIKYSRIRYQAIKSPFEMINAFNVYNAGVLAEDLAEKKGSLL